MASNGKQDMRDYFGDIRASGMGVMQQNDILQRQWPEPLDGTAGRSGFATRPVGANCAVLVIRTLMSYLDPSIRDPTLMDEQKKAQLKKWELKHPVLEWAWRHQPCLSGNDVLTERRANEQLAFLESMWKVRYAEEGEQDAEKRPIPSYDKLMEGYLALHTFWNREECQLFVPSFLTKPFSAPGRAWAIEDTDTSDAQEAAKGLVKYTGEGGQSLAQRIQKMFEAEMQVGDSWYTCMRFPNWPIIIRVMYTPLAPTAPKFEDLRLVNLELPEAKIEDGGLKLGQGRPRQYNLVAVVRKRDDDDDVDSIRLYTLEGRHVVKPLSCGVRSYPYADSLNWKLGETGATYYMYYIRTDVEVVAGLSEDRYSSLEQQRLLAQSIQSAQEASMRVMGPQGPELERM